MVNMQAAALDPNFSDPQVYGPQRPAPQPSVLDMLRGRLAREMEGEALQRIGEFGAGMLASGSPNFFTMLGSGARAAQQGDASRMDRLRQIAEAERQQRALENQEASQRAEAEYRQRRLDVESPLREAQAEQARALAEYYRQGGRGGGTQGVTPALQLRAEQQADREARERFPSPPSGMPASEATLAAIRENRQRYIAQRLPQLIESLRNPGQAPAPDVTAPPTAPAARIDARGNPIR